MSVSESRVLGLDLGTKRIGVAVSDPLGITAQPLPAILVTSEKASIAEVVSLLADYEVKTLVVGLPYRLDGSEGAAVRRTRAWLEKLAPFLDGCQVVEFDERLSSQAAERALLACGLSREKRRRVQDSVAAALVLQNYLACL